MERAMDLEQQRKRAQLIQLTTKALNELVEFLNISKLESIVGSSYGGMVSQPTHPFFQKN